MQVPVWIQPHERGEAIDAYEDFLTQGQAEEIEEAPETALVRLMLDYSNKTSTVLVVEEG